MLKNKLHTSPIVKTLPTVGIDFIRTEGIVVASWTLNVHRTTDDDTTFNDRGGTLNNCIFINLTWEHHVLKIIDAKVFSSLTQQFVFQTRIAELSMCFWMTCHWCCK